MSVCQPADSLVEEGLKLCIDPHQVLVDKGRYPRLVGRLMYLAHTRSDLTYDLSGNLVTWRSKKHNVVTSSSAKAEAWDLGIVKCYAKTTLARFGVFVETADSIVL
ncbi:unnamed protein product [Prunus armeniaca]